MRVRSEAGHTRDQNQLSQLHKLDCRCRAAAWMARGESRYVHSLNVVAVAVSGGRDRNSVLLY